MKKKQFYIITIALILILLILMMINYLNSKKTLNNLTKVFPSPTLILSTQNTIITPTYTPEEVNQLESDKATGDIIQQINTSYPWYNKLPLTNEKYYVYFDLNKNQFIATIFSSSEQNIIKNQVQTELTNLGINYQYYELIWETQ